MSLGFPVRVLGMLSLLVAIAAAAPASASNTALQFDGVDDYVTVADPMNLPGPLTLEAWVKIDADPSGGRIISNRYEGTGFEMDAFKYNDSYMFRFTIGNSAVAYTYVADAPGRWVHFAVTFEGGTGLARIYIDGAFADAGSPGSPIASPSGPLRIGAMGQAGYHYRGTIDEVRIWSTALDGATLSSWMSRPLTAEHPGYSSLEGYWNFDEGSGQVVHNLSGDAGRDGVLGDGSGTDTHDPQWQSEGAPVPVEAVTIGLMKQRFLKP